MRLLVILWLVASPVAATPAAAHGGGLAADGATMIARTGGDIATVAVRPPLAASPRGSWAGAKSISPTALLPARRALRPSAAGSQAILRGLTATATE